MFSVILLILNLIVVTFILFYGLCLLSLTLIKATGRNNNFSTELPDQPVTVLIPCHNEGAAIVSTVNSVVSQDYKGQIDIVVLMKDRDDTSYLPLFSAYSELRQNEPLAVSAGRSIIISCSGSGPKRDKLNFYLKKVTTPLVAFLDADHRAKSDWISQSVAAMQNNNYVGVQSRRAPLSLKKLPQLWDSAQNHIGNEMVNNSLERLTGSVFFTGTTAVFLTEVLKNREFSDCVTEDTYLSYELLRDGYEIGFSSTSGSFEEVAPDIHSYIARRRRWSCGHNKTFFSLSMGIFRSSIGLRHKLAVLIHGLFYTVPVAVCLCLNIIALHLFVQYTRGIQTTIFLIAITIALTITLFTFGKHRSIFRETLVLTFLVFPQVTLFFPVPLYFAEKEIVYFLTMFPYMNYFFWVELACLLCPLLLLTIGSFRIRILTVFQLLLILLSYPLIIFLDLWSCLLGFSDFLIGQPTWKKIRRTQQDDRDSKESAPNSFWLIARAAGVLACAGLLIISVNDLTADTNCGEPDAFLVTPTVFVSDHPITWHIEHEKVLNSSGNLAISFSGKFPEGLQEDVKIAHFIDGTFMKLTEGKEESAHNFMYSDNPGWESHTYSATLKSADIICKRESAFTTVKKEYRGNQLYLNGEKFLVKGIIPSFSPAWATPSLLEGLQQIKDTGANTLRYYHALTTRTKKAVKEKGLLVVDQPDRSTWSDVNLNYYISRKQLKNRFIKLQRSNIGNPYSLFSIFGNELEISNPELLTPELSSLMKEVIDGDPTGFFAYSTFFVYLNLPSAIYGVNMLDSGITYWEEGLKTIQTLNKPFLATEFGGFVAFTEETPEELRVYRMLDYWNRLEEANAMGAIFHQSHDNWAQPIVSGINDPLTPDQPDDRRGIWDVENKEKLTLRFVRQMFSDFDATVSENVILPSASTFTVKLKNRRQYRLRDAVFYLDHKRQNEAISFDPDEEKSLELPLTGVTPVMLRAEYTTHSGLPAVSVIEMNLPLKKETPSILNSDATEISFDQSGSSGKLLRTSQLEVVFPDDWKKIKLNGKEYDVTSGRNQFTLPPIKEEVSDLQSSTDAIEWKEFNPSEAGKGAMRLRFKLKRNYTDKALLILSGLGADHFWIRSEGDEWTKMDAHYYRENSIPLDALNVDKDKYIYLLLPRFKTTFVDTLLHPENRHVPVRLEMPAVFSPTYFQIEKVD